MKTLIKNLPFLAVLTAALTLSACNKQEHGHEHNTGKPDLPDAPMLSHAARYDAADTLGIVKTIILSEGGTYTIIATQTPIDDKGTTLPPLSAGKYTAKEQGSYTLHGFGTMTVIQNTKATTDQEVTIILYPTQYTTKEYSMTVTKTTATTTDALYRLWHIEKTRIGISGSVNLAADFDGCDINEIDTFLSTNGIQHNLDIPKDCKVSGVDISALGSIAILYANGEASNASWEQTSTDSYRISWETNDNGLLYSIDNATVSYLDGSCILTMNANISTNKGTLSVTITWVMNIPRPLTS